MARAAAKSLRSAASTICAISEGISFDDTEMMPRPPIAISGSVSASSPDRTMKSHGAADLAHLRHVPRGFLHADDVLDRRETDERFHVDVDAGAAGHVVEHDRERRAFGDRAIVLKQTFGSRLVVVRGHRQQAIRA